MKFHNQNDWRGEKGADDFGAACLQAVVSVCKPDGSSPQSFSLGKTSTSDLK